jgi:hypothetical protein
VVIYSKVGKIRRALANAGAEDLVSPVAYVYTRPPKTPEEANALEATVQLKYLRCPYLFKDAGFRLEEEVRFVLRVNPATTTELKGALIDMAREDIFETYNVSDELPKAERHLISLFQDHYSKLKLPLPNSPISGFAPSNPFTVEPDLPPGLFPDLDLSDTT